MKNKKEVIAKVRRIGAQEERRIRKAMGVKKSLNRNWDFELRGKPVEVKSSKFTIIHHGYRDYGRFRINKEHHANLINKNGIYVFIIRYGRGKRRTYHVISAKALEHQLHLLKRDKYGETAGISTRWVINNCTEVKKEDLRGVIS